MTGGKTISINYALRPSKAGDLPFSVHLCLAFGSVASYVTYCSDSTEFQYQDQLLSCCRHTTAVLQVSLTYQISYLGYCRNLATLYARL